MHNKPAKITTILFLLFPGYFCSQTWCILQLSLNYSPLLHQFSAKLLLLQGRRKNTPNHSHSRKDHRRQDVMISTRSPTPLSQGRGAASGVHGCHIVHTHIHTHLCVYIYVFVYTHTCTYIHTRASTVPISCYHTPHHLPLLITTLCTTHFTSIHYFLTQSSSIQQPLTSHFIFHPVPLGHRQDCQRKCQKTAQHDQNGNKTTQKAQTARALPLC